MITSRPSFSAVTKSDEAASVDDWCTCLERKIKQSNANVKWMNHFGLEKVTISKDLELNNATLTSTNSYFYCNG